MRVLIVEPDHATAQSLELMLKVEGFNVYTTDLGEDAIDLAKVYDYDLILMERNLPDMAGVPEALRRMRAAGLTVPIIVLSGVPDVTAKVEAFGLGADDYLVKPFHRDELAARARAVVRRSKGHAAARVTAGAVSLDLNARAVEVDGKRVHVTGKEYQMAELLFLRKGSTISKEAFLNHLYGGMDEPELKIVDVFICKLRKKLIDAGAQNHIETVWGRGYRLVDEPVRPTQAALASKTTIRTPADRLATLRSRAMIVLAEHGKELMAGTIAVKLDIPSASAFAVLSQARSQGMIVSNGARGHTRYALTEAGSAFLAAMGWTAKPEALAA